MLLPPPNHQPNRISLCMQDTAIIVQYSYRNTLHHSTALSGGLLVEDMAVASYICNHSSTKRTLLIQMTLPERTILQHQYNQRGHQSIRRDYY